MLARAALAVAVVGCVASNTITCPSGLTCPEDTTCVALATGAELCATDDQLRQCEGVLEFEPCDDADERKRCTSGVCIDLCANGVEDPGETCDDGNRMAGDGCSARCLDEVCGNGVVDVVMGEQCDEGVPQLSSDGCSSGCEAEPPIWRELSNSLTARSHVGIAYDVDRDEVVMFGGLGPDGYRDDTWIWNRTDKTWRAAVPPRSPPARSHHSLVYDRARKRVVLFGGYSSAGVFGDMWEWDGVQWTERTPATLPPARRDAQLAYDVARARVVLHGGSDAYTLTTTSGLATKPPAVVGRTDTWEWDGMTWTQAAPTTVPTAGEVVHLVYDEVLQYTIACIGGLNEATNGTETWTWNGVNWTNEGEPCTFDNGLDVRLAYEGTAVAGRVVVVRTDRNTMQWTGVGWSPTRALPAARHAYGLSFDGDVLIAFGGHATGVLSDATGFRRETYRRQGLTNLDWLEHTAAYQQPRASQLAAAAYDVRRGRGVMFGGETGPTETWLWSARGWEPMALQTTTPYSAPPSLMQHSMVYDSARMRYVMVGGPGSSTWELDGTGWLERSTTGPGQRNDPAMAYDAARGTTLVFGGQLGVTGELGDTWTWDGSTWTQHTPPVSPPARTKAAIAYDPIRARVVMFGGQAGETNPFGDTWEWDGTTWTELVPEGGVAPSPRSRARLVYNPLRQTVLLHGGQASATNGTHSDVWEWTGSAWTLLHDDPRVSRLNHVAFFDSVRGGLVTFGGLSDRVETGFLVGETWLFRFESLQPVELCRSADADLDADGLQGCADPDCWGRCSPSCPPGTTCAPESPRCGDGTCDPDLEDYVLCPADCPAL